MATDSADGPADDSQPLTSTPIPERKSPDGDEELMSTSEVQIVIKQEAPDVYSKDSNNNNSDGTTKGSVNEEVLDSESKADEDDDVMDVSSVSPKDESKLDLWRVKQENPQFAFKGSPAQHHSCPYCQRGFTYLANYRKHIKSICPIRQQIDEKKKQVIEDSAQQLNADGSTTGSANKLIKTELPPTLVYTPSSLSVRSQIEDTVLTLLRDQTKQDQILQSSEDLVKFKSTPKGTDDSSVGQQSAQSGDTEGNANESVKDDSNADSKGDESSNQTKDNVNNNELTQSSTKTPSKGSSFRFRTFPCNICHKIFLSYVAMLKHRLSHKLSGGSAAAAADDNAISDTNELSADRMLSDNELVESNRDKEAANQALAASILKRSKDVIFSKMRVNSSASTTGKTTGSSPKSTAIKPIINTTDLLEKLARGGITTDAIQELSATTAKITTKSSNRSTKHKEVITIETNNNDSQAFNLQLSASTSGGNSHRVNSSHSNSGIEEIIIEANNLNDLDINVLKDGVIVAQDLQELIAVNDGVVAADEDCADGITKCPEK
ncbi:unnamed protein product [Oppiella nova]|uniref:C2H2-type domain-containing protein n=1 Tax=Oppiella nova TaxID=334625 RepID=A0A7R9M8I6_9ACAR|nr:unnamed protein product [Oppiella nova]CAG2172787.1 unnamed protein product [Oppiella nova]